jgi:REP element-mobilizing transposase RayT
MVDHMHLLIAIPPKNAVSHQEEADKRLQQISLWK